MLPQFSRGWSALEAQALAAVRGNEVGQVVGPEQNTKDKRVGLRTVGAAHIDDF